jgi:hypothetical protein
LQVVNFCKHQNPHRDEKSSVIPDRDGKLATIEKPEKKTGKDDAKQDLHAVSTVQAPCKEVANSLAIGLIPDSLKLIPERKPPAQASPTADTSNDSATLEAKQKKSAVTFQTFVSSCRATGSKPIPDSDPVFEWAEGAGVPFDFLHLAWLEFRSRYAESSKRYNDWRRVFRNAVRDNWFKLWFCNEQGVVCLSNQGRLIQKTHAEAT